MRQHEVKLVDVATGFICEFVSIDRDHEIFVLSRM